MHNRHRLLITAWASLIAAEGCTPNAAPPQSAENRASKPAERAANETTTEPKPVKNAPAPTEKTQVANQTTANQQAEQGIVEYEPAPESEDTFALEDGFQLLTLDDFETFKADSDTWSVAEDGIRSTGKPKGYLYSKDNYQNFIWRLEYRFERPKDLKDEAKFKGNTGFMIYINGEHKTWPVSLEVQGKHVELAAIKANGGASAVTTQDDDSVRQAARLPVGQWNRLEIVSRDGALAVRLNDQPISRSDPNFLSEGQIGIQAEDHPFVVRHMRIRRD